jgi:hypothetical protein
MSGEERGGQVVVQGGEGRQLPVVGTCQESAEQSAGKYDSTPVD